VSKTEKLLRELIALPSVNPAFLPAKDRRAGEHRVADFLAATANPATVSESEMTHASWLAASRSAWAGTSSVK